MGSKKIKLTKTITEKDFDNHYWYATELKRFAKEIGIENSSKLRKDELEPAIKKYLKTRKVEQVKRKIKSKKGIKDSDLKLSLSLPINNYTNNKETKEFIEREALKLNPNYKRKSGTRYRLNRWRDDQIMKGNKITYGDLVKEYIKLNERTEPFDRVVGTKYIYFISDYLKHEPQATRKDALKEWAKLKKLYIPKNYQSWKKHNIENHHNE